MTGAAVTDPGLLSQLEGGGPITDPDLLAKLEQGGPDWKDRVQAHQAGFYQGLSYLLGSIPDVFPNTYNLGKAGVGSAYSALTGETPPKALEAGEPSPVAHKIAAALNKVDMPDWLFPSEKDRRLFPTTLNRPEDAASRYIATASGVIPGAAAGSAGPLNLVRNTAAAVPAATAGQAVAEAKPFGEASPSANTAAALVAQLLASGAGPAIGAGTKSLLRAGAPASDIARRTGEFERVTGETPSWGQATGSPTVQGLEQLASTGFGGHTPFENLREGQQAGAAGSVQDLVDALGGVRSKGEAGRLLQGGIEGFKGRTLSTFDPLTGENVSTHGQLQSAADRLVPPGTTVAPRRSLPAFQAAANPIGSSAPALSEALTRPFPAKIAAALESDANGETGGIPYPAFRSARAAVGEEAYPSNPLLVTPDVAGLRKGYYAMNQDLIDALRRAPNAQAAQARADRYYGAAQGRLSTLAPYYDKATPEQAFNSLASGVRDQNLTLLRAVKRSLQPEEYQGQVSTLVDQLGRAAPGAQNATGDAFSFNTFMTNYSRLHPEVRDELFSGYPQAQATRQAMDRLASVAEQMKSGSKVLQSTSGTGPYNEGAHEALGPIAAVATGHFGAAAGLLAIPGARAITSRMMMTNPDFVHWLASASSATPKAFGAHLGALNNLIARETDPEKRAELGNFRDAAARESGLQ